MSEIADFERSAAFELNDVAERIAALVELQPERAVIRAIGRINQRLSPLLAESSRYNHVALVAALRCILAALDAAQEREIDRLMGVPSA